MNAKFDEPISILLGKIRQPVRPDEALKYTQSVQNLANAKATLLGAEIALSGQQKKLTKGAGS
jgi:hypothetical protein